MFVESKKVFFGVVLKMEIRSRWSITWETFTTLQFNTAVYGAMMPVVMISESSKVANEKSGDAWKFIERATSD